MIIALNNVNLIHIIMVCVWHMSIIMYLLLFQMKEMEERVHAAEVRADEAEEKVS